MNQSSIITFKPYIGLIVFSDQGKQQHYLQVHEITNGSWGEGKPFSKESLAELATSIRKEQAESLKLRGLLPDSMLFYQPGLSSRFMWYLEPQQYHITFISSVGIPTGNYQMPGLILAVSGKSMYIWAYKGTGKPKADTEIFHAPFYNVYESGNVCMGTVSESRKKFFLDEELDRWQRRFFGGRFTEAHGEKDRIAAKWTFKKAYQRARKAFPEAALKSFKQPLNHFVDHYMVKGGSDD
jgi:PRTRC genetic system protein B